ncbi:MAG: hypothetical protein IPI07_11650 [Flavobacteriales bacterium]|nr:hypothetical protein [Flavobacteriales bacterium]
MTSRSGLRSMFWPATLLLATTLHAQIPERLGRVAERIAMLRDQAADFRTALLFQAVPPSEKVDALWDRAVRHADVMRFEAVAAAELLLQRPERIALTLPTAAGTIRSSPAGGPHRQ